MVEGIEAATDAVCSVSLILKGKMAAALFKKNINFVLMKINYKDRHGGAYFQSQHSGREVESSRSL